MFESTTLLRHEPVQARSNARLTALLDAAAATIDAVGYERLTTAMVAERAGASIGTVYRYFPDRIAVLHGVAARATDRFVEHLDTTAASKDHASWREAVSAIIDDLVDAFAHQPAFASLRFGDVLDLRPRESKHTNLDVVTARIAHLLSTKHGLPAGDDLAFHLGVAFVLVDTLLARAFTFTRKGDSAYVEQARSLALGYLVGIYGDSARR